MHIELELPKEDDRPRAPIKHLILIALIMLVNSLPVTMLFPYLYFMVRDFHVAKSDEDIGYFVGLIGSAFHFGRFSTGILWGLVADRYGRKPVIFVGVISVLVFNTWFGFSTSVWMAFATRFCFGGLNAILGTVRTVASELCSKDYQALAMAVVSTAWGFGLIIGPAIGGFLAQPAIKYPGVFGGTIFSRFHYLLAPLCASFFALVVLILCVWLPETLHRGSENKPVPQVSKLALLRNRRLMVSLTLYGLASLHDFAYMEVFSLWAVSPKAAGGLSCSTSDVGRVLSAAGCGMLLWQILVFPKITTRMGPTLVTRVAAGLTMPMLCFYPFLSVLPRQWIWVAVFTLSTLKYILIEGIITGLCILLNNSTRQEERGTANGLALSLVSLFKSVGPTVGGSVFAWSRTRKNAEYLPGNEFPFFFLAASMLLVFAGTYDRSLMEPNQYLQIT